MGQKRSLDAFFTVSSPKKPRPESSPPPAILEAVSGTIGKGASTHPTYPHPIPELPQSICDELTTDSAAPGKVINDQPDLDLLYFTSFIAPSVERSLFTFLRQSLFFYRVQYKIKRGSLETDINTPRYTTVFGVDTSSFFSESGEVLDSNSKKTISRDRYPTCKPRPLPACLDHLRILCEAFTGAEYNFCLVNYYASGADSISYHSDDERFLGPEPAIASLSLGAMRDFCMKHKPIPPSTGDPEPAQNKKPPLKLPLASGDMVLMRGKTQACWLHSIPKRKGKGSEGGRINITFRKGVKPFATENYYQYNVGKGPVWRWDAASQSMKEWAAEKSAAVT